MSCTAILALVFVAFLPAASSLTPVLRGSASTTECPVDLKTTMRPDERTADYARLCRWTTSQAKVLQIMEDQYQYIRADNNSPVYWSYKHHWNVLYWSQQWYKLMKPPCPLSRANELLANLETCPDEIKKHPLESLERFRTGVQLQSKAFEIQKEWHELLHSNGNLEKLYNVEKGKPEAEAREAVAASLLLPADNTRRKVDELLGELRDKRFSFPDFIWEQLRSVLKHLKERVREIKDRALVIKGGGFSRARVKNFLS